MKLVEDYGLDGLDVDYEYPQNDEQARGYVELLRGLRAALDEHARRKHANYRFLLTVSAITTSRGAPSLSLTDSCPMWSGQLRKTTHPGDGAIARLLEPHGVRLLSVFVVSDRSFLSLKAELAGSWDKVANHQANVFGDPISASQAVQWYISQGVPRHEIILGVPLYGRSFLNTDGPGSSFSGLGQGSWESGVYDYRALPLPGSFVFRDVHAVASWTYDYERKEMISLDDEAVGCWKGEYIAREGLGGSMFWELSGDKEAPREGMEGGHGKEAQPGRSLIRVVKEAMGELDTRPNWLQYEGSKFENLRNGMQA